MANITANNGAILHSLIDETKYNLWVNILYNKFNISYPIVSIFLGMATFLVGYIISYIYKFNDIYSSTELIYLGTFGIIFFYTILIWATRRYVTILNTIRPCFDISDKEYFETTEKWLKLGFNNNKLLFLSFFCIILGYFLVILIYQYNISMLIIFPDEWLTPPVFFKILIICIYGTVIGLLTVTGITLNYYNILLMNELGKKPIFYNHNIVKKLLPLCNFNLINAISWIIGSGFILRAVYTKLNIIYLPFQLSIILMGFLTFFVPQYSLHITLEKSREKALESIDKMIEMEYKDMWKNPQYFTAEMDLMKFYALDKTRGIVSQSKTWVYDLPTILKLLLSSLIALSQNISDMILK